MILRSLTFSLFLPISALLAQEFDFVRKIDPFPVKDQNSGSYDFPFFGGLNAPRPQFVDIDGDGDFDLFIQEEGRDPNHPGELIFFENVGSATVYDFEWRNDSYQNLDIGNWYKFVDFDSDGDFDLFTESSGSRIQYLKNTGDQANPDFVTLVDTLRDSNGNEVLIDPSSLPDLADIDCDGLADFFLGRAARGTISHYKNLGFDGDGLPQFEFVTDAFQDISIIGEGGALNKSLARHGSNGLIFTDVDNDADLDVLWGDLFEPSIVLLENSGNCTTPDISITTRRYPTSNPIRTGGFNLSRMADIDNDGDADLFVSVLGFVFSSTRNSAENFFYLQNLGPPQQPEFSLRTRQFISTLDVGSNSIPAFIDIDNDLDDDLFLSNEADPADSSRSQLYFFENVGSPEVPKLLLVDDDFLNLKLGFNYAPAFVDIDDDGDPDLFIGEWDGKLNFAENTSSPGSLSFAPVRENLSGIDVGNNNTPTFVDIDDDGDLDLFSGEFLGNINFYRNNGSANSPSFDLATNQYLDIGIENDRLYSYPAFTDIDSDGDQDLIVGFDNREILLYRNMGSPATAKFELDNSLAITIRRRPTPVFIDIDNDGDLDLFSGGNRGGLVFFENQKFVTSVEPVRGSPVIPEGIVLHQNYPNPFNPETKITYRLTIPQNRLGEFHTLAIFNLLGQKIREWQIRNAQRDFGNSVVWDGKDDKGRELASGIYLYRLTLNTATLIRKMTLMR